MPWNSNLGKRPSNVTTSKSGRLPWNAKPQLRRKSEMWLSATREGRGCARSLRALLRPLPQLLGQDLAISCRCTHEQSLCTVSGSGGGAVQFSSAYRCARLLKKDYQVACTTSLPALRLEELPTIPLALVDRVAQADTWYTSSCVAAAQRPGWANSLVGDANQVGFSTPDHWEKQQCLGWSRRREAGVAI